MPGIRDLKGKVAVVTGAGSGIGRATALALAAEGCRVVLADVRGDNATAAAEEIGGRGGNARAYEVDVAERGQVEELAGRVLEEYGPPDVLFNNAGVALAGRFVDLSWEDWEWVMGVDFWGVVHGMTCFLPAMIERRSGHIVNTSSLAGLTMSPAISAYSAAKHAVVGLSKAVRAEVKPHNIGVTVVCPGLIRTHIVATSRIRFRESDPFNQEQMAGFMEKRGIPPEKVAKAVLRGIRRDIPIVTVGVHARLAWFMERLSVCLSDMLMSAVFRRVK